MPVRFKEFRDFRVGETVLIQPGNIYPGFKEMAIRLNADLTKWQQNRSYHNWRDTRDVPATILNFIKAEASCFVLIEDIRGDQYVIDINGLSKPKYSIEPLPEELFEI